jgi:L-lysine 2,3-aminomutase
MDKRGDVKIKLLAPILRNTNNPPEQLKSLYKKLFQLKLTPALTKAIGLRSLKQHFTPKD